MFEDFEISFFNNRSNVFLNLLFIENENTNIYSNMDLTQTIYKATDLNFQILKVISIIEMENRYYFEVQINDGLFGYISPVSSILLVPKQKEQVKICKKDYLKNELNKHLQIEINEKKYIDEGRLLYSSYYALHKGEIFETLISQGELIGFINICGVSQLYKYSADFNIKSSTNTFLDSELIKKFKKVNDVTKTHTTKYIIPKEKKAKFNYGGKDVWIDLNDVNIEYVINEVYPKDYNQALLMSMFFQIEQKLYNSQKYHFNIMNNEG